MIIFEKCCFCVPLRLGCLIMGYVQLVATLSAMITFVYVTVDNFELSKRSRHVEPIYLMNTVNIVKAVILVHAVLFNIVLLVGIHKNKLGYVKYYLVCILVLIIVYSIMILVGLISGSGGIIIAEIAGLLWVLYYLLVIRSQYINMEGDEPDANEKI